MTYSAWKGLESVAMKGDVHCSIHRHPPIAGIADAFDLSNVFSRAGQHSFATVPRPSVLVHPESS